MLFIRRASILRTVRHVLSTALALCGLAALTLSGAAVAASGADADANVLGPGDSVRITVFQNPDLTTEARLTSQGMVRLPLIGAVELGGLGVDAAAQRIAQRYRDGNLLHEPEVSVSLLQIRSRQVAVLGQVARPGRYPLEENGGRLADLLAQAGGITSAGDETVTVIGRRDGQPVRFSVRLASLYRDGDSAANVELHGGDTVYVQRAPVFYIYGEVQRAGAYRLEDNLTVVQAVSLGGGITRRGTERGMRIHRRGDDGSLSRLEARPYDRVQADDVIYVNESLF